jgi:hypothetical protein
MQQWIHQQETPTEGNKMSWIQMQEELDYNRDDSEYRAVLAAEAFDPQQFVDSCDDHGQSFDIRSEHCTECPVFIPKLPEEIWLAEWEDIPPF